MSVCLCVFVCFVCVCSGREQTLLCIYSLLLYRYTAQLVHICSSEREREREIFIREESLRFVLTGCEVDQTSQVCGPGHLVIFWKISSYTFISPFINQSAALRSANFQIGQLSDRGLVCLSSNALLFSPSCDQVCNSSSSKFFELAGIWRWDCWWVAKHWAVGIFGRSVN